MSRTAADLDFRILGPLEVIRRGKPVDLGGPKQRAVLAVLLLSAGRVVSVDRLADDLWPQGAPAGSTGTLQAYVSNLRRALEPERPARTPPAVLMTRAPGYLLSVDAAQVDASRFEAGAREGRGLLESGEPAAARRVLAGALALWRGPALTDFAYEPFAQAAVARLEQLRAVAVEDLVDADLALGNHERVIADLEALVVEHPTRERLWGQLMVALYRSGRQSDALGAFQRARAVLRDELGLEPGPDLRRLESAVLTHDQALLAPHPPAAVEATAPLAPSEAPRRVLVGRTAEVGVLETALARAAGGHGGLVLVAGEAGIGKTRLAEELVARARAAGMEVAWGRGYDGQGPPAFWSWVQVLRALIPRADVDLVRTVASDLVDLVPEVKDLAGDVSSPPALDPVAARFRVCDSATRLLLGMAARRPVVVVLDDAHWADPASLQLLSFLSTYVAESSLLVAVTYRDTDVGPPLRQALGALVRQPGVQRVTLGGLSEADVGEFLTAAGVEADAEVVAGLHARTHGHPFYLSELVQLLRSDGDTRPVEGAVPAGVMDVVARRLAQLPGDVTPLLEVAAVVGTEFDLPVVAAASGVDSGDTLERLEPALSVRLVTEGADGRRYQFVHSLVRDAVYDHVPAGRRSRLHRQVAEALEAAPGAVDDSRAGQVAYHYDRAAVSDKAAVWLYEAGRRARRSYLNEDAVERLSRARSWLELEGGGQSLELDVHEELGDALRPLARHAEARASYRAALARVPASASTSRRRARLQRKVGVTLGSEGRLAEALQAYAEAERLLDEEPPGERDESWCAEWIDAHIEEMWIHYQAGDWEVMESVAARLEPVVAESGTAAHKVGLQRTLGALTVRRDRYVVGDEALTYSRAALEEAERSGDDVLRGSAWFSSGFALLSNGDLDASESALTTALELARRTGDVSTETAAHAYLTMAARFRGDVDAVRTRAGIALQKATATGATGYVAAATANLAWVALRDGDAARAGALAHEAVATWDGSTIVHAFHWQALWPLVKLAVDDGDAAEARRLSRRLVAAEQQRPPPELEARLVEATADGLPDGAVLDVLRDALVVAEKRGYV